MDERGKLGLVGPTPSRVVVDMVVAVGRQSSRSDWWYKQVRPANPECFPGTTVGGEGHQRLVVTVGS